MNTSITSPVYTENSIRTYTGKVFDLKILDPESICIEDIAHGLANTARFAGQLEKFYSVAQHSFYVAMNVSKENQLAALLHDASEAYLGDMPSPFKKMLPDFKEQEDRLMKVIAQKFGFEYPLHKEIKEMDVEVLQNEWGWFVDKSTNDVPCYLPEIAEKQFLAMFEEITKNQDSVTVSLDSLNIGDTYKYSLTDVGIFKVLAKDEGNWIKTVRIQSGRVTGGFPWTEVYPVKE